MVRQTPRRSRLACTTRAFSCGSPPSACRFSAFRPRALLCRRQKRRRWIPWAQWFTASQSRRRPVAPRFRLVCRAFCVFCCGVVRRSMSRRRRLHSLPVGALPYRTSATTCFCTCCRRPCGWRICAPRAARTHPVVPIRTLASAKRPGQFVYNIVSFCFHSHFALHCIRGGQVESRGLRRFHNNIGAERGLYKRFIAMVAEP